MLTRSHRQSGFTLVELMLGLGVLALLMMIAVPAFSVAMQNARIRNAADGVLNGVQLARAEAVRRNRAVEFAFTEGGNWVVTQLSPLEELQKRADADGAKDAVVESGASSRVTFGPMGAPLAINPQDGTDPMTRIDITPSMKMDGVRPLAILISSAGSVRMCDPDTHLPAGDTRRCEK